MINWLLREIERNPATLFRKKDLLSRSREQFEQLKSYGLLEYSQPSSHHETYPCPLTCDNTCPMEVVEMDGFLFAICGKSSEIDPVRIDKDDLHKYAFSVDALINKIRITNKIDGTAHSIDEGCTYIGYKSCRGVRAGFVFVAKSQQVVTLKLIGLRQLCQDDKVLVILSPATLIEDVSERKRLYDKKIVQVSLATSLDQSTFKLPIDSLVADLKDGGGEEEASKRGRKRKYSLEKVKQIYKSFENHKKKHAVITAWNLAAKEHSIKTGKAAEMACRRYLPQNK